ncbi:MAG: hypothetical protein ACI91T_003149, partial [Natronomonas sp.]
FKRSFRTGWLRILTVGIATGVVGGMGTFSYTRVDLSPFDAAWLPLLFVGLAGAYTHLLAVDMRSGTIAMIIGFVVGGFTNIAAWTSPIFLLPYGGIARDLALMAQLQQSLISLLMVYLLIYLGGYFAAVTISGATS